MEKILVTQWNLTRLCWKNINKVSVILHEQNRGRITVTKQMAQALLRRINKTISGVIWQVFHEKAFQRSSLLGFSYSTSPAFTLSLLTVCGTPKNFFTVPDNFLHYLFEEATIFSLLQLFYHPFCCCNNSGTVKFKIFGN